MTPDGQGVLPDSGPSPALVPTDPGAHTAHPASAGVPARYLPAPWVRALDALGWRALAVLIVVASILLVLTNHTNLAVLGVPPSLVALALMYSLPRRLPRINEAGTRDLNQVEREALPLVLYALALPLLEIPIVLLTNVAPLPIVGGPATSPIVSAPWVLGSKIALLLVPALIFGFRFGRANRQLGLRRVNSAWRWVGPLAPAAILLYVLAGMSGFDPGGRPPTQVLIVAFIAFAHAGLPEEAYYRALLQTRLELLLGSRNGIAVASFLFGLRHLPSHVAWIWLGATGSLLGDTLLAAGGILTYQTVIGIVYGYMWMRYRNGWLNIAVHTAFDTITFLALIR